ncbi:uncharacterized protein BX664DRAFT_320710 [Halteromyces radiatus]|uniref:uncharacterized protein n=1 Tax=Halteromyces radiatus TaxID=101107 RepID=UPI00221E824E|nr:uncharacterized protein BX664DRAFT_320710 [Halteromyces radiatus]KAI8099218.1 hypothetical protein BX664DRAFT_320710 [Halteromyces radiatus]
MPTTESEQNVKTWINKPHSFDNTDTVSRVSSVSTTIAEDLADIHLDTKNEYVLSTSKRSSLLENRQYPSLPPSPPPPIPPSVLEKSSVSSYRKRISTLGAKRKSFSHATKTLNFFTKNEKFNRPKSMDLFTIPTPSPTPVKTKKRKSFDKEKPLPAVPIEQKRDSERKMSLNEESKIKEVNFEPLRLRDITMILDRNERMLAYNKAFERCINTVSPLKGVFKSLKKKPPCPPVHKDQYESVKIKTPKKALTLPSLIAKKNGAYSSLKI